MYLVPGGVPGPGGYLVPGGVPGPGGTCPGTPPPPVNRMTDSVKTTLATSLRTVKIQKVSFAVGKSGCPPYYRDSQLSRHIVQKYEVR